MKTSRQAVLDAPPPLFLRDDTTSLRDFRNMVLAYYQDHGRDLLFRRTTDPYHILVSEIMLQQTQVERVNVKYPAFVDAFPDFPSLASAPLPDVLAAWQGMGTTGGQFPCRNVPEGLSKSMMQSCRRILQSLSLSRYWQGNCRIYLCLCLQYAGHLYRNEYPQGLHSLFLFR